MSFPSTESVSRFVHQYRGIEGFYFLNKSGELGFIKLNDLRSVKETFPQLNDRHFLKVHPDFLDQLEGFLRDLGELSALYLTADQANMELGYVLPAGKDQSQRWRSATLVLHKNIVDAVRADENLLFKKGIKDTFDDAEQDKTQGVRSIQRGLDDLTHHRDAFGVFKYFPVLFYLPEPEDNFNADRARLRVLNLKWRPTPFTNDAPTTSAPSGNGRETVYSVLRSNLLSRGAIDRSKRLEHRMSVA